MTKISRQAHNEIELCRDLVALLDVCEAAAQQGPAGLARTIDTASAYAKQIQTTIEMLARRGAL